jgi:hypothetical protein
MYDSDCGNKKFSFTEGQFKVIFTGTPTIDSKKNNGFW